MNILTLSLSRLTIVVAGALSLGACSRAEYATKAQATTSPLTFAVAGQSSASVGQVAPYVPVAAEESAVVKAPGATSPTTAAIAQPNASYPTSEVAAKPVTAAPLAVAPAAKPAPKLSLVQRLALHKITKKLDKLTAQVPQLKKQDAAARGGLDGNLRSAILFGLIGLILVILGSVANIFAILGTIAFVIGVVFLVLWLLDQA